MKSLIRLTHLKKISLGSALIIAASLAPANAETTVEYSGTLQADVYASSSPELSPAILLIHGGGWSVGNRKEMEGFAKLFTQRGFVAVAMDYRLLPTAIWPAQAEDVSAALCWMSENAKAYKIDPARIGIFGVSAGGHLAAWAATHPAKCRSGQVAPKALIALYAPWDLTQDSSNIKGKEASQRLAGGRSLWSLSPQASIDARMPPSLLIHGTKDQTVPFEQSQTACKRIQAVQRHCELMALEGDAHGFSAQPSYYPAVAARALSFMLQFLR